MLLASHGAGQTVIEFGVGTIYMYSGAIYMYSGAIYMYSGAIYMYSGHLLRKAAPEQSSQDGSHTRCVVQWQRKLFVS